MLWTDGTKYQGEWNKDKMHGQGTYTYLMEKLMPGLLIIIPRVSRQRYLIHG